MRAYLVSALNEGLKHLQEQIEAEACLVWLGFVESGRVSAVYELKHANAQEQIEAGRGLSGLLSAPAGITCAELRSTVRCALILQH